MQQNLLSRLKKSFFFAFLSLSLPPISQADTLQVKKDIFLIDVSRSMQGRGGVSTPNIFEDVKHELISAFGKARHSKAVLIPFSDKANGGLSIELPQDSSVVKTYIKRLNPVGGRTDIYRAWMAGLDSLRWDASANRIYLITDALHNSKKYSLDSLRTLLSLWQGEDKDAYLVLLNPAFDGSELASLFRSQSRMHVVNSLQDLYNQAESDTPTDEVAVGSVETVDPSEQSRGRSLLWLWVLLVVGGIGGVAYTFHKRKVSGQAHGVLLESESNNIPLLSGERAPQDVTQNISLEVNDTPGIPSLERSGKWEESGLTLTDLPRGKRALDVVECEGRLVPEINNLNGHESLYPDDVNKALYTERRKAVTPSHQFPTLAQLENKASDNQVLGASASGAILRENLFTVMDPQMRKYIEAFGGVAAHHVVEGNDPAAIASRRILEQFGIDINDAANGIFLPSDSNRSIFKGAVHKTHHTEEYSEYVYRELKDCKSREEVIKKLTEIKHHLYDGKLSLQGDNQEYNKNIKSKSQN